MECSVCYESGACRRLCCGHEFCSKCIKSWYLKGTGTGCPMCRRPIYFKGFKKVEEQWTQDAWETKCSDVFQETIETTFENLTASLNIWPEEFHAFFRRRAIKDLVMAERMFVCMKQCGFDADEIDYLLNETDLYFSKADREFKAEPIREKVPYARNRVNKGMRFKKNNVR